MSNWGKEKVYELLWDPGIYQRTRLCIKSKPSTPWLKDIAYDFTSLNPGRRSLISII